MLHQHVLVIQHRNVLRRLETSKLVKNLLPEDMLIDWRSPKTSRWEDGEGLINMFQRESFGRWLVWGELDLKANTEFSLIKGNAYKYILEISPFISKSKDVQPHVATPINIHTSAGGKYWNCRLTSVKFGDEFNQTCLRYIDIRWIG